MIVPVVFFKRSTVPAETRLLLPANIPASLTMHLKPLLGSFRDFKSARALVGVLGISYCLRRKGKGGVVCSVRS